MDLFVGANREDAKYFIPYRNTYENLGFLVFVSLVVHEKKNHVGNPYTSGSLRRPHPTYGKGSFAHMFSTLQKKPPLSEIT